MYPILVSGDSILGAKVCCNSRSDENFISKKKILKLKQFLFEVENFKIAACAFHRCPHMNFVTPSFWLGWVVGFP